MKLVLVFIHSFIHLYSAEGRGGSGAPPRNTGCKMEIHPGWAPCTHTLNLTTCLYMFLEDEGRKPIRTQEEDVKLHSKPLYSRASPSQALLLYSSIDRRITTVT